MRFAFNLSCRFPALPAPYRECCNSTRLGSLNQRTFLPRADTPTEAVVLFGLNWRTNEESMLIYFIETESIKKYIERLPYWESVSNTVVVEEMTRTIGKKIFAGSSLLAPSTQQSSSWVVWLNFGVAFSDKVLIQFWLGTVTFGELPWVELVSSRITKTKLRVASTGGGPTLFQCFPNCSCLFPSCFASVSCVSLCPLIQRVPLRDQSQNKSLQEFL